MSTENLEQSGWEPSACWVGDSPEQQDQLDRRYRAEEIADRAHDWPREGTDDEPYDREASVQRVIAIIVARESYASRPLSDVLRDSMSWIEAAQDDKNRYNVRHTLMGEASSLLSRIGEHPDEKEGIEPNLLSLSVQWAALEYFTYWYDRSWPEENITPKTFVALIEEAGLPKDDFEELILKPVNSEAAGLLNQRESTRICTANQLSIEAQMLKRAKELGAEVGEVHNYGNYLQSWGI